MMIIVGTTLYLFIWRKKDERPTFVITQMIFLNFYWIIYFIAFFGFALPEIRSDGAKVYTGTGLENTMTTMGDLCVLIPDWIYTE